MLESLHPYVPLQIADLLCFLVSGQDLTVFIAWAQCLFSAATVLVATVVKRFLIPNTPWLGIPLVTFIHQDTLAMTFTFIGVIVMNNLLLKHIGVAFYQVARSSTLIFTVIFSRVFLQVQVSPQVVVSCLLIIVGFVVSVDQEMLISSLSWLSIFYGVLASLSAALSGIFTKRVDRLVKGNSLEISLTNNINSIILLFPLVVSTGQLQFTINSDYIIDQAMWFRLAVTGMLSLFVGWASIKVITLTSPVTHNMSINAKSVLQTFIAVMVQGETKTMAWWVGNVLVVLGLINYSLSRSQHSGVQEMEVVIATSSIANQTSAKRISSRKEIFSL